MTEFGTSLYGLVERIVEKAISGGEKLGAVGGTRDSVRSKAARADTGSN